MVAGGPEGWHIGRLTCRGRYMDNTGSYCVVTTCTNVQVVLLFAMCIIWLSCIILFVKEEAKVREHHAERYTHDKLADFIGSVEDQRAVVLKYWITTTIAEGHGSYYVHCIPSGEIMDYLPEMYQPLPVFVYPDEENNFGEAMWYATDYWAKVLEKEWDRYLAARPPRSE